MSYLSEMNARLAEANVHWECGDLQAAEACFVEALKWNDVHAHYCYGNFLFWSNRKAEAAKYLESTFENDYPAAIVFVLMLKIHENGDKWVDVDEAMLKKIQIAADKGHLIAAKYITEYKMKHSGRIKETFKYGLQLRRLNREFKRIMKDPKANQTPVWY